MEILLEHTVNSLFPHCSSQNHFLLTSLYTQFRSNTSLPQPLPQRRRPPTSSTNQHLREKKKSAGNSHRGRPRIYQGVLTRLMECKVPFINSTGVGDEDIAVTGTSSRKNFHKKLSKKKIIRANYSQNL